MESDSSADHETQILALLEKSPIPVSDILSMIREAKTGNGAKKCNEWTALLLQALTDAEDFANLYLVIKDRQSVLADTLKPVGIRDALKKANKDRLTAVLIDAAAFGEQPLAESFRRLDLLLALKPGAQVIDTAWGFGIVKRLDDFYKRATLDFAGKPAHPMPLATACDTLSLAPHDHLLTRRHTDPQGTARLVEEAPGELVKLALHSFGDMPIAKLEDLLTRERLVPAGKWKTFWESARKALKNDPLVTIPTKRADSLQLRSEAETYGDAWFDALATNKDPVSILNAVNELDTVGKLIGLESTRRGILEDRLAFGIKGAHNTDAALYARLAVTVDRLKFLTPPVDQLRAHLWEQHRYIQAAEEMSVRDIAAMATFLLAEGGHAAIRMLDALPLMPFSLLNEVLGLLKASPEADEACRTLLAQPKAPPTLVNWVFRFRKELSAWHLPPLIDLLNHAIILVEGRLSGEALRMQNNVKQLFEQPKWLDTVFDELSETQRQLFFERIQASTAWDPSTHRSLIGRMLKLDPALAERKKSNSAQHTDTVVRWTSWHSFKERQLQYKHLVEVEMPKNSRDIEVARSYGDLRENFEYQAAKDYQRQLLQRHEELQQELKLVKGTDFNDLPADKAGMGTRVTLLLKDGTQRTYAILGEWDSDASLNIISNKTRLALCLEGKRTGERVLIPVPGGEEEAQVEAIRPLDDTIKAWIQSAPKEIA